eukprot:5187472-Amphidinium_carterae.2
MLRDLAADSDTRFVVHRCCWERQCKVEYAKECDLPTELFAKYPYPLEGKTLSDRMSSSLYLQGTSPSSQSKGNSQASTCNNLASLMVSQCVRHGAV